MSATELAFKPFTRQQMAQHAAADIPEGWDVNLGIGIPTMIADHVPRDREVIFHSENGVLGMGPAPAKDKIEPWLINAGKQYVTMHEGGSFLPPCRQLCDDPRPPSGSVRAGRIPGRRQR